MADLAVMDGRGNEFAARAWRARDTCELDFDRPDGQPPIFTEAGWPADLAHRLQRTAFGDGIQIVRLRFSIDTPAPARLAPGLPHASRRIGYFLRPLPELNWAGGELPDVHPLTRTDEGTFVSAFERIFATEALGFGTRPAVSALAARLFRGEPIEGWTGYRGFVIGDPERPIGTFFIGPPGEPPLNFGLAGLAPEARRTRQGVAAAVAVVRALENLGADALQFEIDDRNAASRVMALRRGAHPIYRVLVLGLAEG